MNSTATAAAANTVATVSADINSSGLLQNSPKYSMRQAVSISGSQVNGSATPTDLLDGSGGAKQVDSDRGISAMATSDIACDLAER